MNPQIKSANVSITKMRNSILLNGAICCLLYIAFFFLMKLVGLVHVTELRFVNYLILFFVCFKLIKGWIKETGSYVMFLQVLGTSLFTGVWSFILFSSFLYIYSQFNKELAELFVQRSMGMFSTAPSIIILFEGAAASIIVAFINMQYFRRYEEGEKRPDK